jgi:hypothetical protein
MESTPQDGDVSKVIATPPNSSALFVTRPKATFEKGIEIKTALESACKETSPVGVVKSVGDRGKPGNDGANRMSLWGAHDENLHNHVSSKRNVPANLAALAGGRSAARGRSFL